MFSLISRFQSFPFSQTSTERLKRNRSETNSELAFVHNRVYISELWEYARWPLVSLHVLLDHKSKCTAKAVHASCEAVQWGYRSALTEKLHFNHLAATLRAEGCQRTPDPVMVYVQSLKLYLLYSINCSSPFFVFSSLFCILIVFVWVTTTTLPAPIFD